MKRILICLLALLTSVVAMAQPGPGADPNSTIDTKQEIVDIVTGVVLDCHPATLVMARINYHYVKTDQDKKQTIYYVLTGQQKLANGTEVEAPYYIDYPSSTQYYVNGRQERCGELSTLKQHADSAAVINGGDSLYTSIRDMVEKTTALEVAKTNPNDRFNTTYAGYIMDTIYDGSTNSTTVKPVYYIAVYSTGVGPSIPYGTQFAPAISISTHLDASLVDITADPISHRRQHQIFTGTWKNMSNTGMATSNIMIVDDTEDCVNSIHTYQVAFSKTRYNENGTPYIYPYFALAKIDVTIGICNDNELIDIHNALRRFRKEYPTFDEENYKASGFVATGTFTAADVTLLTQYKEQGQLHLYQEEWEQYLPFGTKICNQAFPILTTFEDIYTASDFETCMQVQESLPLVPERLPETTGFIWGRAGAPTPDVMNYEPYVKRIYKNDTIVLPVGKVGLIPTRVGVYKLTKSNDPDFQNEHSQRLYFAPVSQPATLQVGDNIEFALYSKAGYYENSFLVDTTNGNFEGFNEGYYYTFEFSHFDEPQQQPAPAYNQNNSNSGIQYASDQTQEYCDAGAPFTLKIIPEYAHYSGKYKPTCQEEWNKDENWQVAIRSSTSNIYRPCYAPAAKTKVFIHFERAVLPMHETIADTFDIVSRTKSYAIFEDGFKINTCDTIHFWGNQAELGCQYLLNYNAAIYDIDIQGSTWSLVGFPLKDVVSGDIFTEHADNNDPFIINSKGSTKNVRVWQKIFNHNMENMTWSGLDTVQSTAWNTPTNTVKHRYNPGTAVMIWPLDISDIANQGGDITFHFPKRDTEYYYFNANGLVQTNIKEQVPLLDGETGRSSRLAYEIDENGVMEITLTATTTSDMFAFANPTVDLINIEEFEKANANVIQKVIYPITGNENATTVSPQPILGKITANPAGSGLKQSGYLSPTEAVMLKAKTPGTTLTVKIPATALKAYLDRKDQYQLSPVSEANTTPVLYMTAQCNKQTSYASIYEQTEASNDFYSNEDAEMLFIDSKTTPAAVYTVASNRALAINGVSTFTNIPMAIYSTDSTATTATVTFNGVDSFDGEISLLDITDGSLTLISEGDVLTLATTTQNENIRYYLQKTINTTTDTEIVDNNDINIYVAADGTIQVVANDDLINVVVYGAAGQEVMNSNVNNRYISYALPTGIYMVKAHTQHSQTTKKVVVK